MAIARAIPAIKSIIDRFFTLYVHYEINKLDDQLKKGLEKTLKEDNQIDLEKALGSPTAGKPSNNPGTEIRDSLPGVK